MQGLEILTSEQIGIAYSFNTVAFFIVAIIITGIFVAIGIFEGEVVQMVVGGMLFGVFLGGVSGALLGEPTDYETQYKVTISDEISMAEFLEQYEIIDQEGKILTIKEKNNESN